MAPRGRPSTPGDALAIWLSVEIRRGKPPYGLNWACETVAKGLKKRVIGESLSGPGVKFQHRSIETRRKKEPQFRDYTSELRTHFKAQTAALDEPLILPYRKRMGGLTMFVTLHGPTKQSG